MAVRMTYQDMPVEVYQAMLEVEKTVKQFDIEPQLLQLIKIRASEINGCAFCLDMHIKEAKKTGESMQRIYSLPVWQESPYYTPKERAVLRWTEELTLIHQYHASDEAYTTLQQYFDQQQIGQLNLAIIAINGWNRLILAMRTEPGSYQVR